MSITKKNHYNPCFWTAFWNIEYLDSHRNNAIENLDPRKMNVCVLNLKANKIILQKTEKIFFERNAGLAVVSEENIINYCKRAIVLPNF